MMRKAVNTRMGMFLSVSQRPSAYRSDHPTSRRQFSLAMVSLGLPIRLIESLGFGEYAVGHT